MLDKILGKKDKNQRKVPDLRKNKKSGSNFGERLINIVSKPKGTVPKPDKKASQPNIMVSKLDNKTSKQEGIISKPKAIFSKRKKIISDRDPDIVPDIVPDHELEGEPEIVSDRDPENEPEIISILNSKSPNRINAKKVGEDKDSKDSKDSEDSEDSKDSKDSKNDSPMKRIPRPMPKPRTKERPTLKPSSSDKDKKPGGFAGFGRRVPSKIPDDDRRTLIGAAVFGIILIVLVGAGYYFLVYAPYQDQLQTAKTAKINEVNAYYKGALAGDPQEHMIMAQIDGAKTPNEALAVDVLGPATQSWRLYQNQQISANQDPFGRVMITYAAGGQKDRIVKTADAQTIVNEADASVLANMAVEKPDTVAVPIIVSRVQAAGGLINVGDAVDVYLNSNGTATATPTNASENVTTPTPITTLNQSTPQISGATVLAILRWQGSGSVSANRSVSASVAFNTFSSSSSSSKSASTDVEQLLRASASRSLNTTQINSLLEAYGWRLSDFERVSNLGELDAQYLVMLEVPRENALWLIQNSPNVVLTVPTSSAPSWMEDELHAIYG